MKSIIIRTCLLTASILVLSLFIVLLQGEWSLVSFVNVAFLLALLPFIIGGFLFVYEGGFFKGVMYGFRRLHTSRSKAGRYLAELQGLSDEQPVQAKKFTVTYPLLFSGLILLLLTIAAGYAIR